MTIPDAVIRQCIRQYVAQHGPTNPWRIARDTGIPEDAIIAAASQWQQRAPVDGPGQNYIVA